MKEACYGNYPLGVSRGSRHSFNDIKLTVFSKLVTLMAFGYRMEAISILGREVMQPRGLIGLGYDSLDSCQPEIAEVIVFPKLFYGPS